MKNLNQLFYLLLCFVTMFFLSCSDDESPTPGTDTDTTDGKSMFIVEYQQSGDVNVFNKYFSLGKGFLHFDTKGKAPELLSTGDLKNQNYKFITEEPIEQLELGLSLFWIDVPNYDYAEMDANIKVYRDEVLIDSISVFINSDNVHYESGWEYEGL